MKMRAEFALFIALLQYLFNYCVAIAEVRCYCNLASCADTGNMCKSVGSEAACFTEHLGHKLTRHGCVEQLKGDELQASCQRSADSRAAAITRFPTLVCCRNDMCNYKNTVDPSSGRNNVSSSASARHHQWPTDLSWVKLAIIVVPIGGSIILIILILFTVRLLRHDGRARSQQQFELLRKQRERQSVKPDLLLNLSAVCNNADCNSTTKTIKTPCAESVYNV